jgi:nicotinamide-nucleotide amidase
MTTAPDTVLLRELADALGRRLVQQGLRMATAESCSGGWIAKIITDLPGSSDWFELGMVSYSNTAKQQWLGVREETLRRHGAVSEATVREMVEGVLARSAADLAVAVSGIAGPGGATTDKPVGTVCFAWGRVGAVYSERRLFSGDREGVRRETVAHALRGLIPVLERAG